MAMQLLIIAAGAVDIKTTTTLIALSVAASATGIVAGLTLMHRCPPVLPVLGVFTVAIVAATISDSSANVLTFNSIWLMHLANAMAAALIRSWWAFVVHAVGAVGYSLAVALAHPSWGPSIPQGQLVAGVMIVLAVRTSLALLGEVTDRADAQADAAAEQAEHLAWIREMGRETAHRARILHDTVINTLAAIATGASADRQLVRERCTSDQRTIDEILHSQAGIVGADRPFGSLDRTGIAVHLDGLAEAGLRAHLAQCPDLVVDSLERAVFEVLQNVAKHAGVTTATLHSALVDGRLAVTVSDSGAGFDPAAVEFRGLASSVFARAAEAGIEVDLSSRPGHGTSVQFLLPPPGKFQQSTPVDGPTPGYQLESVVATIRHGATWLWAIGVLVVTAGLEGLVDNPGEWRLTYLAIGLGVLGVLLAWLTRGASTSVRRVISGVLIALIPIAFVLCALDTDFGRDKPTEWKVLTMTGVVVIVWATSRTAGLVAVAVQVATGVAVSSFLWASSPNAALIVVSAALMSALFNLAWAQFEEALRRIGQGLVEQERHLLAIRVEQRQVEATAASRQRWQDAGLVRARAILQGLAEGSLEPSDAAVRRACGEEESHLRQLVQLSPEMVRLGPWLARALDVARERGVDLRLRCGDVEPSAQEVVDRIGQMLDDAVRTTPAGQGLTITIIGTPEGDLTVTLVGPRGLLADSVRRDADLADLEHRLTSTASQDLLEATVPL
ncbi:ATP-binding protein [Nocardioides sp. AE5]|uniref:ATP-binding protein n=1 Tax=Nocardioides sp. AE5 TaxID=2962573 RepID=UPI0028821FBF|nr:ATP-binding protein [Nocardioides sp. AE5]MDT0203408.1 hypothetical protein [Nocardioides sp. AE5]